MYSSLDITTPTDHADAYTWAAVLTAHAAIGMVLTVELHGFMPLWWASLVALFGYLLAWEGGVQRFGAGLLDALVDAAGIAAGVGYAIGTFFTWPGYRWAALALLFVILAGGVWKRRKCQR